MSRYSKGASILSSTAGSNLHSQCIQSTQLRIVHRLCHVPTVTIFLHAAHIRAMACYWKSRILSETESGRVVDSANPFAVALQHFLSRLCPKHQSQTFDMQLPCFGEYPMTRIVAASSRSAFVPCVGARVLIHHSIVNTISMSSKTKQVRCPSSTAAFHDICDESSRPPMTKMLSVLRFLSLY